MKKVLWNAVALAVVALLVDRRVPLGARSSSRATRDEAQPADVILVLGAAEYRGRPSPVLRARLDHALDLYQRKLAPRILTTGGAGGDPVFTEGGVGRSYLISRGVPSEAIIVENEGESTVQSTAMAGEIMRRMGLHSVIVVSDGYHIYRVKKMLEFRGLKVYGSPRKEHSHGAASRALELCEAGHRLPALAGGHAGIGAITAATASTNGRSAKRYRHQSEPSPLATALDRFPRPARRAGRLSCSRVRLLSGCRARLHYCVGVSKWRLGHSTGFLFVRLRDRFCAQSASFR